MPRSAAERPPQRRPSPLISILSLSPVVKVVTWSRGLTWRSQVGANPIPIPHPTNLVSFGHKITLYRFNQGSSYHCRGTRGWAAPPPPPYFNHWLSPECSNNHTPLHTEENPSIGFAVQLRWENPSHTIKSIHLCCRPRFKNVWPRSLTFQSKKVSYCKQILRRHSRSTVYKLSSHPGCCYLYCVCTCWRSQKFWGQRCPRPLGIGHVVDNPLVTRYSPTSFCTKFRRSRSNRSGVDRRIPQKIWGRWDPAPLRCGHNWPLRNTFLFYHSFYHAEYGHSRSNHMGVINRYCQKKLTPHIPPFKVTRGHWNRHGSISYLWLPIRNP